MLSGVLGVFVIFLLVDFVDGFILLMFRFLVVWIVGLIELFFGLVFFFVVGVGLRMIW